MEGIGLKDFTLTVFSKKGEKLLDETFSANDDDEAKTIGEKMLAEKDFSEHTHRCVTHDARLILFHR